MLRRLLPLLAVAAIVLPVALLNLSSPFPVGAESVQYEDPTPGCPTYTMQVFSSPEPGVAIISITFTPDYRNFGQDYLDLERANLALNWRNWSAPTNGNVFVGGSYQGVVFVGSAGVPNWIKQIWWIPTGPGSIAFELTGYVTLANGYGTCRLPRDQIKTMANIGGSSGGIPFSQNDLIPATADLDNDNVADDNHCGNACNKDQDEAEEAEQNALRVKICYQLDKHADARAFKACKQSGNGAIAAREGHGWSCWYEANRDGWKGPTAPENAPKNPDGSTYTGDYYGDGCGYHVTPEPTMPIVLTPRPTPNLTNCAILTPVPTGSGYIRCDVDGVHVLDDQPGIPGTQTPAPTPSPAPVVGLYVYPDDGVQPSQIVTVEWSNIPSPTSSDWIVLYRADGTHQVPTLKIYTDNCNAGNHGSTAVANGSCAVHLPSSGSNFPIGTYHFRLYHNASESAGDLVQSSNTFERTP